MVMLPRSAIILPKFVAVPPASTSTKNPTGFEGSDGFCASAKNTFLPAAKIVCPSGVRIMPLFSTVSENNKTFPPGAALITAPASTTNFLSIAPAN